LGLLKRKPKISIEEFCREFYDSQIFQPIIAGEDVGSVFCDAVFNSVSEADPSFATVDRTVFRQEMTALRMELFSLAWVHHFKQGKYTLPQTDFTKSYLEKKGRLDIWNSILDYNQAVAHSSVITATEEQENTSWITYINSLRAGLLNKWVETGIDKECAVCVANRMGTENSCKKGITLQVLNTRLADRLGCDVSLSFEALFRLEAVILGLYHVATESIKSANLNL